MAINILITGGTGFLGSYLIHSLLQNNYQVILVKRSTSNTWRINDIIDKIKCYDLDKSNIDIVFKEQHIDIVIHTACCYGRNYETMSQIVDTNIVFGIKLFESAVLFNTVTFINTDTLLQKHLNSYSLSKYQFVEWLKRGTGKIKIVNMKLEYMYGPNDDTTKFVPWVIEQLRQNKDRINLTKGKQRRDFVYITDVVSAYIKVLERINLLPQFVEFDVGTGKPITVYQFVSEVEKKYKTIYTENKTKLCWGIIPYRKGEMMKVSVNVNPLKAIGWKPEYSYQEGINNIISFPSLCL